MPKKVPTKTPKKAVAKKACTKKLVKKMLEEVKTETPQPMGLGQLGYSNVVFARKFRWTLEATHLESFFQKSVKIDYLNKTIKFSSYQVYDTQGEGQPKSDSLIWAERLRNGMYHSDDEEMKFCTYDGCGNCLERTLFSGLKIIELQQDECDYESSDPCLMRVTVQYEDVAYGKGDKDPTFPDWQIELIDSKGVSSGICQIKSRERPRLEVEETQVDHLNAKMWLPGKARWLPFTFSTKDTNFKSFVRIPTHIEKYTAVLRYHEEGKLLETWTLGAAWIQKLDMGSSIELVLRFSEVRYNKAEQTI